MAAVAQATCDAPDCDRPGIPCFLQPPLSDEEPAQWLCGQHAREQGYCPGCGLFWSGESGFDVSGWCSNCRSEMEEDEDEDADAPFGWEELP